MRANQLAMRDPALAAVLGLAVMGGRNPSFGHESSFGDDFGGLGNPFGDDMGDDMGADDMGYDFGGDAPAARPAPAAMARMAAAHVQRQRKTKARTSLLNPNGDSTVKVDGYVFSVNITNPATGVSPLVGTASSLIGQNTPDVYFRPSRATLNVNFPAFVLVNEIKVGNVSGTVGGISDGYDYSPLGVGMTMSLPLMSPSTKASFLGSLSAFAPPAFVVGASYPLTLSFRGPATMTPNG